VAFAGMSGAVQAKNPAIKAFADVLANNKSASKSS
jgi:hypothetical protein